jgi:alkylation response protein AidB-like acyl-CoA dehydrogenase
MANPVIDTRDVHFILFEMLEVDKMSKYNKFKDFDRATYDEVIALAEKIAMDKLEPFNTEADKTHAIYKPETKEVIIPPCFKAAHEGYYGAGFYGVSVDQELGGMGMPFPIYYATLDFFTCASVAFSLAPMLSIGAMNLIIGFMPECKRKEVIIEKMMSGEWGGTMCLTEPDAGSDVGALKTKAKKNADGTYSITGNKIFITDGENDTYKNMSHPVLARIEGDPAGTKGISIFMVPKFWINDDGSMAEHNDVICTGIEHKMGITASATCSMSFGDNGKCRGILMGEERMGMKIMFQMMNEARLFVGSQGMSVSSSSYLHAVTYAKNRIQSPEAGGAPDKGVPIIRHPDVKRMLLSMKSRVEAMRALTYFIAQNIDLEEVESGERKAEAQALVEWLIPVNKAGNTDSGWEITGDGIKVFGGYGFIEEYPMAQHARDSKIFCLYEGTNGIQSLDLTLRKCLMNKDQYNYKVFKKYINETISKAKGVVDDKYIKVMEKAVVKADELVEYLKGQAGAKNMAYVLGNAVPFAKAIEMLTYGWMQLWGLTIATKKMKELTGGKTGAELEKLCEDNAEAAFYTGRVLSGQFYLGAKMQEYFGRADYVLAGEAAVQNANKFIFSGAPEE